MTKLSAHILNAYREALSLADCNLQDANDVLAHQFFVAQAFAEQANRDLEKAKKELKKQAPDIDAVIQTHYYDIAFTYKSPRGIFDKPLAVERLSTELKVPKHRVLEIMDACVKFSAAPLTITVSPQE